MLKRFCHWMNARRINAIARHEDDPFADALSWMNDLLYRRGDAFNYHAFMRALAEDANFRDDNVIVVVRDDLSADIHANASLTWNELSAKIQFAIINNSELANERAFVQTTDGNILSVCVAFTEYSDAPPDTCMELIDIR